MGINLGMGFDLNSPQFIDSRQSFETKEELLASDVTLFPEGYLTYCKNEGLYYKLTLNNEGLLIWEEFKGSGSGGGGAIIGTITSTFNKTVCNVGEEIIIDFFFSTPNIGKGNIHITVNGIEKINQEVRLGQGSVSIGTLNKGRNEISVYIVDTAGVFTNVLNFSVECGALDITSDFNAQIDYTIGAYIEFPYNIDTISKEDITMHFIIDDNEELVVKNDPGYYTYSLQSLDVGVHSFKVYATSGTYTSNELNYNIVIINSTSLYVSTTLKETTFEENTQINIPFRISMLGVKTFVVEQYIDGNLFRTLNCFVGTNYWSISTLTQGVHRLDIKVTPSGKTENFTLTLNLTIIENTSYQPIKPVTQGLLCYYDATDLSNSDLDRANWKDLSGNNIKATLYNFNFANPPRDQLGNIIPSGANGWVDDYLLCTGKSYVEIDLKPFEYNARYGLTFDILYESRDVGNVAARVLDCTEIDSGLGVATPGVYIDTLDSYIASVSNTRKSAYAQSEKTRVTYVIDRKNKLAQIYVNAVFCEVILLSDIGIEPNVTLENFAHNQKIYLNSQKGIKNFGECKIYNLRVYGRALTHEEVLQNHIADIKDPILQKAKYDKNYNDAMPTIYMIGDSSAMTKDIAVKLKVTYLATEGYGQSFEKEDCMVSWQGTSSLQYSVKNFKIKLYNKYIDKVNYEKFMYTPFENGIPEYIFTLKCDYMESSHMNNTGLAKIIDNYLYDTPNPAKAINPLVRETINGFPVQLYMGETKESAKLVGVFNFNLDKNCYDSYGMTKSFPNCVCYEVIANSDTTAGAFNKWTEDMTQQVEDTNGQLITIPLPKEKYYLNDFELRYATNSSTSKEKLYRLVEWVSDASDTEFRTNLSQYFNIEHLIRYYIQTIMFGKVDNLGFWLK